MDPCELGRKVPGVSALCRFWLLPSDRLPLSTAALALLRAASLRRVLVADVLVADVLVADVGDSSPADELARSVLGTRAEPLGSPACDTTLRALSSSHPAESLALICPRDTALELVRFALDLPKPPPLAAETFLFATLDWPSTEDLSGRPSLIGLDLDWLPPPPPRRRAKFPGGPGSAAASRA